VIGAPGTPTPRGLAAIYERNRQPDPHGFIGPWSLSLTAHSNVLESFGGGPGRVAIHGREGASLRDPLGSARSHGCVRVSSRAVTWLALRAVPGTPVDVRR
jgi:lipoprotein-anchoring transpeptidase ErfK/SrfK